MDAEIAVTGTAPPKTKCTMSIGISRGSRSCSPSKRPKNRNVYGATKCCTIPKTSEPFRIDILSWAGNLGRGPCKILRFGNCQTALMGPEPDQSRGMPNTIRHHGENT